MTKILKDSSTKNFIFAGLFLGLAFGTKYNGIFYFLVLGIICLYAFAKPTILQTAKEVFSLKNIKKYIILVLVFLASWIITNPTVITNYVRALNDNDKTISEWNCDDYPTLFWSDCHGRGFLFQFRNVGNKTAEEYPASLYENLVTQSINDYGLTLYLAIALIALLFLFFNYRTKVIVITMLVPIFMYFYISSKDRNPSHYFVFLYPLLAIAVVNFIKDVSDRLPKFLTRQFNFKVKQKYSSYIFYIFFIVLMVSPVVGSVKTVLYFSRPDTRNLAQNYLQQNLTSEDTVYYYRGELEQLADEPYNFEKLSRVESEQTDASALPFYLMIGVKDVLYDELMGGDRDTNKIEGNLSKFLNDSELVFYEEGTNRYGPPVFIFKVNSVEAPR
jgi:4-amino-4-deoxy-L-arabinose transferase-like glycosyltransferase